MKDLQIDKNSIILDGLNDLSQDFNNLLTLKDSVTYRNCKNLNVKINSSINKLIIKNSNNFNITVDKMVSGIEILNCKNINLITTDKKPIYHLYIENSDDIEILIGKKQFNNTKIDIIDSDNLIFLDYNKEKILKV
tara:strand:- start:483 stop:890 length:408 start_codon:yes stop_codon:yes gene_type:complete